jgi:hypothetical protein
MPLASCRECGREVSTEAQICPHCSVGRPAAKPTAVSSPPERPEDVRQRRVWPTLGCLSILGVLLWGIDQGAHDQPSLALGQVYRVKRNMPACPSSEDLNRIMSLVAA